jgi:hypothetical protein
MTNTLAEPLLIDPEFWCSRSNAENFSSALRAGKNLYVVLAFHMVNFTDRAHDEA